MAPRTQRLSTRIVALFLLLLLAVQAAGLLAIRAGMEAAAQASVAQELDVGERIGRRLLARRASASQALADELKALSGLDVALRVPAEGGAWRIAAHTLPDGTHAALAQAQGSRLRVSGSAWQVRTLAIADGAQLLLMASPERALAPLVRLQWTLAAITVVGMVVFGLGGMLAARRVTTPLRALADAAGRLAAGDYTQAIAHDGRRDEVGVLSEAFEDMRVSIAAHESEIRELAYSDRLTGLPNRTRLRQLLQGLLSEAAEGEQVAVLMLGLDRFKHVNDALGWAHGDQLLQVVAQRLWRAVGAAAGIGTVARVGSDTFAVLVPRGGQAEAQRMAERLQRVLQAPVMLHDQRVDVSAAFGLAVSPDHGLQADPLLGHAEVAMHEAKRRTTSCVVYDPSIDSASAQTLTLLSELRRAVLRDELQLFLQPKMALDSGALVGAEALLRWQHPRRGLLPPAEFLPFAEQTGFVRQLTLWVLDACAQAVPGLQAVGVQRVSVNLSTRDLMDPELPQRLQHIVTTQGASPGLFCLEITESAIMDDPQRALEVLHALSQAGFRLSIDDFGTGYSSLAYLKRLPVDELKIDRSFVMAMERDSDDATIVRSTIDLAHNLGLSVVAEGVETAGAWDLLQGLGCDEAQGYHLSRPLPLGAFVAFAQGWLQRRVETVGPG